ncbi:hypothetical protein [Halorhabdus salina]|uniref:hypothetical protein n=1 Tax=Halorhabdus salina TaxID=2750670 RepID=UPI0015EE7ED7|nr:hypothetical protein [Halorhabdus salina]
MSQSTDQHSRTYWAPPNEYEFGEGSIQARKQRGEDVDEDLTLPGGDRWTDAAEIRKAGKLFEETPAAFDTEVWDFDLYPDTLIHEKPADEWSSSGGTDWAAIGGRGAGKTTHNRQWALRLMEMNPDEIVVWRGSPSRSGWSDLREWATLWLPANASVGASWRSEHRGVAPDESDLEDAVRQVVRYEDPVDLLDQLGEQPGGTFHVVYPDPSFTGCEELTARTNRVSERLPFVPAWETIGDESPTPLQHWWFAFLLAAVEFRQSQYWLSLIFDEAGDLAPEDAEEDDHRTFKKLSLLRSVYADSRKYRLSLYWSYHYGENIHHKFRREIERRISMPDGSPNPTTDRTRSIPVGFDTVPMYADLVGDRKVGSALMYDESNFALYSWKDLSRIGEDDRWLKIDLDEPERDDEEDDGDDEPSLEYDTSIFKRWSAGDEDRLYVRDPGAGYVDAVSGVEVEPLESPREDLQFAGIREAGDERIISMLPQASEEEIVVARIPIREFGLDLGTDDEQIADSGGDGR